ncbi:MAG TPA: hypothetical protein VHO26_10625 [Propionibacteriaceae bacterium]|nr:hypothetical protein [Propionibacteriaceae bacterium]
MPRHQLPRRTDRGLSESVQWTLLATTTVLLVIAAVQTAIVLHTRSVVANAALAAAEARALLDAPGDSAVEAARSVASQSGLTSISVTSSLEPTLVTVTVISPVPVLVGFGPRQVSATATVPREP